MTRGQQIAVAVTCLLAALTYAGAVTTWAMGLFVLPGVAGAALLATLLAARGMSEMAVGVVGGLVLGWAELANIWTGTANGPAARSTAVAAGCTVIGVVLAHSRRPALFLTGVAGVVVGAVVLGAAGEVRIVVVAAAVCAALTLGWIERSRLNWTAPPRRGLALVLLSLLAGAAATGAVLLQAYEDPRDPTLLAQDVEHPRFTPAWTDPLGVANPKPKQPRSSAEAPREASEPAPKHSTRPEAVPVSKRASRSIWLYVAVAIVLGVLVVAVLLAARLIATRVAWRRVRRRMATGEPPDQVTGAWAWTRMRLEACRLPLGADVSPDVVVAGRALEDVPASVHEPLRALAASTTTAAFSREQSVGAADAAAAWTAADKADESARELLTRRDRARLAFRGPAVAVRSH